MYTAELKIFAQVVNHALLLAVYYESEAGADDEAEDDAVEDVLSFGLEVGLLEDDVDEGEKPGDEHRNSNPEPTGSLFLQTDGFVADFHGATAVEVIDADMLHEGLVVHERDGEHGHGGEGEPDGHFYGFHQNPRYDEYAEEEVDALDLVVEAEAVETRLYGAAHQLFVDYFLTVEFLFEEVHLLAHLQKILISHCGVVFKN